LAVELLGWSSVALIGSLGEIPRALPKLSWPEFRQLPDVLIGAVAVGAIGLVQASGVSQLYPNPDGSYPSPSRDFVAQGVGNAVGGLFRAVPTGGSLSSTALVVKSGAKSRRGNIYLAVFVADGIVVFGNLLTYIPLSSLAALLIIAGFNRLRFRSIQVVGQTSRQSQLIMIATFVATLVLSIPQAVALGVVAAIIVYVYRSANDIRLVEVVRRADGLFEEVDPPATLPSDRVTLLDVYGSVFFAGPSNLRRHLPSAQGAHNAVVVLRLPGQGDIGSTFLNVVEGYAAELRAGSGKLLLSGDNERLMDQLRRAGLLDTIGPANVFPARSVVHASSAAAVSTAGAWLETRHREPASTAPTDAPSTRP
jgi:sulfate permease, SulP family